MPPPMVIYYLYCHYNANMDGFLITTNKNFYFLGSFRSEGIKNR